MKGIDDKIRKLERAIRSIVNTDSRGFKLLPPDGSALIAIELRSCKASLTKDIRTRKDMIVFSRLNPEMMDAMVWNLQTTYSPTRSMKYYTEERGRRYSYSLKNFAKEILNQLASYCGR